jgi:thiamine-phosphate pyrophosphorylase
MALSRAQDLARQQGKQHIEPHHLLWGLLQEEEGRSALLLKLAGVDPASVCRSLAPMPLDSTAEPAEGELPLDATARSIFRDAAELARVLSEERTLASDQVLLALLRREEVLRSSLEGMGLIFNQLEQEVLKSQAPPLKLDEPLHLEEVPDQVSTARILDASANRAREALRVLEDYCRFALDDGFLTAALKGLRHALAEALEPLPSGLLLTARDTSADVGTQITTAREHERSDLLAVVQANWKRLQEALRTLEEFGKLHSRELGHAIEELRYRSYTLEKALFLGAQSRDRLADARLYVLVTASLCRVSLAGTIAEAAGGGADIIQLREKDLDDRALLQTAREMRQLTHKLGMLFIVNDRPDIALLARADGVHLGQEDMPLRDARRILGAEAIIGVSTHDIAQVRQAVLDGANYIGVGPTFPSATKSFAEFPGLDFVQQATAETSLPLFVLGGVTRTNLNQVLAAGARRVAVSHAVCQADDPRAAAAAFSQVLREAGHTDGH